MSNKNIINEIFSGLDELNNSVKGMLNDPKRVARGKTLLHLHEVKQGYIKQYNNAKRTQFLIDQAIAKNEKFKDSFNEE